MLVHTFNAITQEDFEFKDSLVVTPCLKKQQQKKIKGNGETYSKKLFWTLCPFTFQYDLLFQLF
jgi:hypothetical protein